MNKEKVFVGSVGFVQVKVEFSGFLPRVETNIVTALATETVESDRRIEDTNAVSYGVNEADRVLWCVFNRRLGQ